MTSIRYVFTTPSATDAAIEFDRGRLQGRLEAVVLMALAALGGICVWLVMAP